MGNPEIEQAYEEFMDDIQPSINQGWVWRDCRPFLKEIDRLKVENEQLKEEIKKYEYAEEYRDYHVYQ